MKYSINLSSRAYVNKKALYLFYLLCGVILLVGLLYNLAYYFDLNAQISTTETRLAELEQKILASQGEDAADYSEARYEKVLSEIRLANEILDRDSFRWTVLLDQLEGAVPGNVRIESISPDHEKNLVKLTGMAKKLKDLKRFLDNLIKSEIYEDVLLFSQSAEQGGEIKFSIELLGAF